MLITITDKTATHSAHLETMKQDITFVIRKGVKFAWRDSVAVAVTEVSHCMPFVSIDLLCVTALHCYPTVISSQLQSTATPTQLVKTTTPPPNHDDTVVATHVSGPVESPSIVDSSWRSIQPASSTVFNSLASSVVSFSTAFNRPASSVASSSPSLVSSVSLSSSSLVSSVSLSSSSLVAPTSSVSLSSSSLVAPTSSVSLSSTTSRSPTRTGLVLVPNSALFITPSNVLNRPGGLTDFSTGIAWGVGIGVGGTGLLLSMCLGVFCCVACIRRYLKSSTLDKADFDDSAAHAGMPLGAVHCCMCTVNQSS